MESSTWIKFDKSSAEQAMRPINVEIRTRAFWIRLQTTQRIDNKVKVCFLAASKFNYGAFIDILSDLKENQFIQKSIQNKDLIKIINEIIS